MLAKLFSFFNVNNSSSKTTGSLRDDFEKQSTSKEFSEAAQVKYQLLVIGHSTVSSPRTRILF